MRVLSVLFLQQKEINYPPLRLMMPNQRKLFLFTSSISTVAVPNQVRLDLLVRCFSLSVTGQILNHTTATFPWKNEIIFKFLYFGVYILYFSSLLDPIIGHGNVKLINETVFLVLK